jgi:hypothetical protein
MAARDMNPEDMLKVPGVLSVEEGDGKTGWSFRLVMNDIVSEPSRLSPLIEMLPLNSCIVFFDPKYPARDGDKIGAPAVMWNARDGLQLAWLGHGFGATCPIPIDREDAVAYLEVCAQFHGADSEDRVMIWTADPAETSYSSAHYQGTTTRTPSRERSFLNARLGRT